MAKKPTTELVDTNVRTVRAFEFTAADADAAQQMGIMLAGPVGDRITRAVVSYNMAARLAVEAGYLLLSVKNESAHGDFENAILETGLSRQRASELMRMAKFTTSLPEEQRADMLTMPKSKVLLLASADAAVIEDLLNDEDGGDLDTLSVRELRLRIRELQANNADLSVQSDAMQAERDGALKRLNKRSQRDEDEGGVPLVMADLRAEIAALVKKAELSIDSFTPLGVELMGFRGHDQAGVWVDGTGRLAITGLVALRVLADGAIKRFADALDLDHGSFAGKPEALSFLTADEVLEVAREWPGLTSLHGHEEALRKHERDQAKPKGKGRPAAAPKAPKA